MRKVTALALVLVVIWFNSAGAQTPTGTIVGIVKDPAGASIQEATVRLLHRESGLGRETRSGERGDYSVPALATGTYLVTAEAPGFQRLMREALVEAGSTTTVDLIMTLGE